jgi:hypothetical protein
MIKAYSRSFFAFLGVAALASGCSFSTSSESSSDSSGSVSDLASSPLASLSYSSLNEQQKYEQALRDYTAEFAVSSGGDMESFRVRVGKLAEKHGVTNWEEDKSTYVAIGRGLRKADLNKSQYEAFKNSLGQSDPKKMQFIEEGYR